MAESKRTFQSAKMDKDSDERILRPGEYRDALNVSVDFSEDGNVGAIENLKGNELIANQNIYGLSSSTNPNAKVVGSYPHPEEQKIYYFVTGDSADGIFEYDVQANAINTVLIDSRQNIEKDLDSLTFQNAGVSVSIKQDGTIIPSTAIGQPSVNTGDFAPNTTGSAIARNVFVNVRVPSEYKNSGKYVSGNVSASQPSITAPEVFANEATKINETTAQLNGGLTNNSVNVTAIGFYYGYNTGGTALTLSELQNGGTGITRFTFTTSTIKSDFNTIATSLANNKLISFVAFATNAVGTSTSTIKTFTTKTTPPVNRISGTEYVVVPVIEDTLNTTDSLGRNAEEINNRNVGYGSFFKTSGDCILSIIGPSSDGIENNATDVSAFSGIQLGTNPGVTSNPTGLNFKSIGGQFGNNGYIWLDNFASNTSYQITIPSIGGISSKTIRINNGTPSGTYYTSTLNLNLSGVFVAKASLGGAYRYNDSTSSIPVASYVLGPVLSGETAQCIIPLNNVNTLFTTQTAQPFVSTFDPAKLTVTVSGKTESVDYNYYIEDTSSAIFGCTPGIIFEGKPSLLGATPTVNITYTP
tara:strand:- start:4781 stop:6532 length:1752 start_codon:yes stop_codon:yes gene_type:complete